MNDFVGKTIGSYRIDAFLGQGGVGEVYRATKLGLNLVVVIKALRPALSADPGARARFEQEGQAVARLDHPNIVRVYDAFEEHGQLFLALEFVPDGALRALLGQWAALPTRPLPLGLDLVRQAALGLAYAHAQGLVHRDIKPDNLLLRRQSDAPDQRLPGLPGAYQLKISDFGLARLLEGDGLQTLGGVPIGTPAYMSPEQCQGLPLDGKSDQYSLGVVLYEVATGFLPFQAQSPTDAYAKHVQTQPPLPSSVRPDLSPALDQIILTCLAKRPEDRFPSTAQLASALQVMLDGAVGDLAAKTVVDTPALGGVPTPNPWRTPNVQPGPRIRVTLSEQALTIAPGATATSTVVVTNAGATVDHFTILVEGVPPEWVAEQGWEVQLAPGAQQMVRLTITAPRAPTSRADTYTVVIQARSRQNPSESGSAQARWTVLPYVVESLQVRPARAAGRGEARYTVTVRNDGNAPGEYALTGEDPEDKLRFRFTPEPLEVRPGGAGTAELRARGPLHFFHGGERTDFTIRAQPVSGAPMQSTQAAFTNVAILPTWAPALLVALSALLVVLVVGSELIVKWPIPWGQPALTHTPTMTTTAPVVAALIVHQYQGRQDVQARAQSDAVTHCGDSSEKLLSGGYWIQERGGQDNTHQGVAASYPSDDQSWTVTAYNGVDGSTMTVNTFAFCLRSNVPVDITRKAATMRADPHRTVTAKADCASGVVVAGGFHLHDAKGGFIVASQPDVDGGGDHNGWKAKVFGTSVNGVSGTDFDVWVVCASAPISRGDNQTISVSPKPGEQPDALANHCPNTQLLTGGGFDTSLAGDPAPNADKWPVAVFINHMYGGDQGEGPGSSAQWKVTAYNGGSNTQTIESVAMCVTPPQHV